MGNDGEATLIPGIVAFRSDETTTPDVRANP